MMSSSSSSHQPKAVVVSLSEKLFSDALHRYIDYYKPDPISQKQLEGWKFLWTNDEDNTTSTSSEDRSTFNASQVVGDSITHQLHGTLEITGTYLVISLRVTCCWTIAVSSDDILSSSSTTDTEKTKPEYGDFQFSCLASARILTQKEFQDDEMEGSSSKKKQNKVYSKMVTRLKEDAYIAKLLDAKHQQLLFAQAKIHISKDHLEERVTVSEDICEGIRRAIWPAAESPLEVAEVLLHLPFLPTNDQTDLTRTTALANRAKLRLLEDAMCDACETQGEEELLEELEITTKKKKR